MGCQIELSDTGVLVELHKFDFAALAKHYLTQSRGYRFDYNLTGDFDFYRGPVRGERATLRRKDGRWQVAVWIEGDAKVTRAGEYDGEPVWHGEYCVEGHWRVVCNGAGRPIAYANTAAALAGAEFMLGEGRRVAI